MKVLDRGPEVGALVTFHAKNSGAADITRKLLAKKINVVTSYRNYAVIDFDEKKVSAAVRVSPHYYNTHEEIDLFIDELKKIV